MRRLLLLLKKIYTEIQNLPSYVYLMNLLQIHLAEMQLYDGIYLASPAVSNYINFKTGITKARRSIESDKKVAVKSSI